MTEEKNNLEKLYGMVAIDLDLSKQDVEQLMNDKLQLKENIKKQKQKI